MKCFVLPYVLALGVSCWIVEVQALADGFTVGGAVYTDLESPIFSGLTGVEVCVDCVGGFSACTVTAGSWGGWDVSDVPADSCTVTPNAEDWCFVHVEAGVIGELAPITIIVDENHVGENLSLQFLGTTGTSLCCVTSGDCDDGDACTVDECLDGVCTSTANDCAADFDCDGSVGAADLALLLGGWGPCPACEADLDGDGEIDAFDLALLLGSWGVCP